jgi:hypothetical protein
MHPTPTARLELLQRAKTRTARVYANLEAELTTQHAEWRDALDTVRDCAAENARPIRHMVHSPSWMAAYARDAEWHAQNCAALNVIRRRARAEADEAARAYRRERDWQRAERDLMARGVAHLFAGEAA